MNDFLVSLFFVIPLLDVGCWVAWRNAQGRNRDFFFAALLVLGIPQAGFLLDVLIRIAIAVFSGTQL